MRPFCPTHAERDELQAIATRVAKLTISRTNPHEFFEIKSELPANRAPMTIYDGIVTPVILRNSQ